MCVLYRRLSLGTRCVDYLPNFARFSQGPIPFSQEYCTLDRMTFSLEVANNMTQ
ncbi:hypothetical protein PROFUN_00437 [Planoprotostelium fungivorum]|uniref:Uncharacterized protein n=1 Tax=Planoprotostelium fungivorum TaxID=1890364 RepID=A0A2P6N0T8_9EUKA|nr:hypothetical protein PROFUN_00437 [Planoprotostelium fungivorum]